MMNEQINKRLIEKMNELTRIHLITLIIADISKKKSGCVHKFGQKNIRIVLASARACSTVKTRSGGGFFFFRP